MPQLDAMLVADRHGAIVFVNTQTERCSVKTLASRVEGTFRRVRARDV